MARLNDGGTVRVVRRPVQRKVPVRTSPVFGPVGAVGPQRAHEQARRRTAAARLPILRRTSVPYVPKLARPSPAQRSAQIRTVGLGLKRQGVTDAEVRALARGEGGRANQVAVNSYLGRNATQTRKLLAQAARNAGHTGTETELARHGARIVAQTLAQAKPGDQHTRLGLPGATIDLSHLQHEAAFKASPVFGSGGGIAQIASPVFRGLADVGSATYHHPGAVLGHTATGLAQMLAGIPAGVGALAAGTVVPIVKGHPGQALNTWERLAKATGQDFKRRYGPLVAGNDAAFKARLVKEGLAPELADASTFVGGEGALVGRALSKAARAGALGDRAARFASEARPLLRVSGNEARVQDLSPNLFRVGAQRTEDRVRQGVTARRNRDVSRGGLRSGLQPRPVEGPAPRAGVVRAQGEVVRLTQAKAQRVAVSRLSARAFARNRNEQAAQIGKGVERDLAGLSKAQRGAVMHVASGYIPLHARAGETREAYIGRVRQAIRARAAQIIEHRRANGVADDRRC